MVEVVASTKVEVEMVVTEVVGGGEGGLVFCSHLVIFLSILYIIQLAAIILLFDCI